MIFNSKGSWLLQAVVICLYFIFTVYLHFSSQFYPFIRLVGCLFVVDFFSFLSRPFHTFLSQLLIVILNLRFVLLNDKLTFKRLNGHWKRLSNWIYRCQYTSIYSTKVTCNETRLKQKKITWNRRRSWRTMQANTKIIIVVMNATHGKCVTKHSDVTECCYWMTKKRVFNEMPTQRTWM